MQAEIAEGGVARLLEADDLAPLALDIIDLGHVLALGGARRLDQFLVLGLDHLVLALEGQELAVVVDLFLLEQIDLLLPGFVAGAETGDPVIRLFQLLAGGGILVPLLLQLGFQARQPLGQGFAFAACGFQGAAGLLQLLLHGFDALVEGGLLVLQTRASGLELLDSLLACCNLLLFFLQLFFLLQKAQAQDGIELLGVGQAFLEGGVLLAGGLDHLFGQFLGFEAGLQFGHEVPVADDQQTGGEQEDHHDDHHDVGEGGPEGTALVVGV